MLALLLSALVPCHAASTGRLPAWVCGQGVPPLFVDGFEAGGVIYREPSGGSGWVPSTDYAVMHAVQAVLNDIAAHYDIDASRIHGWGFSAGGHVLHDLALRQRDGAPDIHDLAAYAVSAGALQGYACTSSVDCAALLTQVARRIPVDLRVGGSDPLLPYLQADHARFQAAGWGADAALSVFPAGHVVVPSQLQPTWDFLCRFQRLPD